MAITPPEARRLSEEDSQLVSAMEADIDSDLKNNFGLDSKVHTHEVHYSNKPLSEKVLSQVRYNYSQAGWTVVRLEEDKQKGRYTYVIELKAKEYGSGGSLMA